jgi:hypothetical protein
LSRWKRCICLATLLLAVSLLAGCQKKGQLEVALVTGLVTFDGKPLGQGTVIFTPTKGRGARGEISSDGSFTLSTYGEEDGATVGGHQVSIIALEGEVAFESDQQQRWLIPSHYGAPSTSGLECEVEAGKENRPSFDLSSK